MELDDQIVNRTIAEFMGGFLDKHDEDYVLTVMPYIKSLDALVPVWEKLEFVQLVCDWIDGKYLFGIYTKFNNCNESKTIQQAAAYATYKAIKELSK
jgi:hypothetical protein